MRLRFYFIAALFISANAAFFAGAFWGTWPWSYAYYFFWAECALAGAMTVFLYAKHLLVFFALLLAVGYAAGFKNLLAHNSNDLSLLLAFWGIYSLCWLTYFEIRKSALGHFLRLAHPLTQFLSYLSYMLSAASVSAALSSMLVFGKPLIPMLPLASLHSLVVMIVLIPTLTIVFLRIVDMIGARHFIDFLLGAYRHPVERKRIVMFIDMIGSSARAEKLSPKVAMEMIAQFIFDAGLIFRLHGGDIVSYTGDGLAVLWPIDQADRALAAIQSLGARLHSRRVMYIHKFGSVPEFRTGFHAGDIVLSQIGEEKLFLGLYGDVVNTAARVEQMNKLLGTRLLFSKAFKQRLSFRMKHNVKPMGVIEVPGREGSVEVFTLSNP